VPLEPLEPFDRRERPVDPRSSSAVSMNPRSCAASVASRPRPMLVGEVRCATIVAGRHLDVVGGRK
jgi:hypothetical protein